MTLAKIRKIVFLLALMILAAATGYWWGTREVSISRENLKPQIAVVKKEVPAIVPVDFSLFWEVWQRLIRDFIDKTKLDPQKMVWGAISGMVQSLQDPYTVFLPPKENKEAKEELQGTFEGIGAQLGMKDKKIVVIAPLKGMPAEAAGILAGDVILKIDGEETAGWTLPQAVAKIRGPKGTKVVLTIIHANDDLKAVESEPVEIEIVRGQINVSSVEVEMVSAPCRAAHLKLMRFGDKTAGEWEKAVEEINQQLTINNKQFKGVILDVRNNPGGYLQGAVFVSSEFLKSGPVVIQEDAQGRKEPFSVNRQGKLTEVPLVVLINKGSASASEIVAGVLKERKGAVLVGETSFGKGSIQEAQDLPQGAGLHITTSRWLLPSGAWLNDHGLDPEIIIEDDLETEVDEQLEKAMDVLCK